MSLPKFGPVLAVSVFCVLGAHALYFGGAAAVADVTTLKSRWLIDHQPGKLGRDDIQTLSLSFEDARKLTPGNPDVYERLAWLQLAEANVRGDSGKSVASLERALANYQQAASLRPMSPYTWAKIVECADRLGGRDQEMWKAFDLAMRYGRNERPVQTILASVAYSRESELSAERRKQLGDVFSGAGKLLKKDLLEIARSRRVEPGKW